MKRYPRAGESFMMSYDLTVLGQVSPDSRTLAISSSGPITYNQTGLVQCQGTWLPWTLQISAYLECFGWY